MRYRGLQFEHKKEPGRTLLATWGPPWHWIPAFIRSRYHQGWSISWLGLSIFSIPFSLRMILLSGVYPRCKRCHRHLFDTRLNHPPRKDDPVEYCDPCWESAPFGPS